jgi:glycosyltransferase involved in cell wall biosynthesis
VTDRPAAVSVVVPVFNSAESLAELVERVGRVRTAHNGPLELILVNDGSRDASAKTLDDLAANHAWIRVIHLLRNYGQHNATLCGIRAARHETTVTIDDDLQNPPEEIPALLAVLAEGWDVVYGTPDVQQHGLWRNLASRITKRALQSTMGAANARSVSAFRAFRSEIRSSFQHYHGPYVSIDVLLSWGASRYTTQRVRHDPRRHGPSNYDLPKLVSHAVDMMTGFSVWPLRVASFVGFAAAFFGLAVLFYVIGRYILQGGSVPGFPFLAATIAIFSGAQLFALGIIGEYLARMHFRAMDRPTYAIRHDTGPFGSPTSRESLQPENGP